MTILHTRILNAYDKLWEITIKLNKLDGDFGNLINLIFMGVISPIDLRERIKQSKIELDETFIAKNVRDILPNWDEIDELEPYVNGYISDMVRAKYRFIGRYIYLCLEGSIINSHKDDLIQKGLEPLYEKNEIEDFDLTDSNMIIRIIEEFDENIIENIRANIAKLLPN